MEGYCKQDCEDVCVGFVVSSEIGNGLAAKWTAILTFPAPLLNALCVENVLFVTVERRDKVIAQEVAPADGALEP